jgi:hypothetical protein
LFPDPVLVSALFRFSIPAPGIEIQAADICITLQVQQAVIRGTIVTDIDMIETTIMGEKVWQHDRLVPTQGVDMHDWFACYLGRFNQ